MIKNKFISFLLSFIVSGIISGFVYLILFIETFDLFGVDEVIDPEKRHAKLFYTGLVMTLLAATIVVLFFKNNKKYTAIGAGLPNLIGVFLILKFGIVYFNKSNYYENFDQKVWIKRKPIKMARLLVKNSMLIGMPKEKVIELLGQGVEDNWNNEHSINYSTDLIYGTLGLTFENGKVKSARIWDND